MIVQACLNGARRPSYHPALPLTPEEIAADALGAVQAGASELHVHPRGPDGLESLSAAAIGATVASIRAVLPGTLIGVSTGAWIEGDGERTLSCIAGWNDLPDYASVNLNEPAAPEVIGALRRMGVGVEAGVHARADARRLLRTGLLGSCLRILVEMDEQDLDSATTEAAAVMELLGAAKPVLLHGRDATMWPFIKLAARLRVSTRVGLEDGATMPDGGIAASNAALVAAAVALPRA